MTKASGIYQIRNTVNGKRYVGSAVCIRSRVQQHKRQLKAGRHHSVKLQNSWRKHGPKAFVFEPMLICATSDLLFYEQRAIDTLKGYTDGYNCAPTAGNQTGLKHTKESRRKMSETRTGAKRTPEQCKTQSRAQRSRTDVATYEFNGRSQTMLQWAEELGWDKDTLARRVRELGKDRAFSTPNRYEDPTYRLVVQYDGREWLLTDLAKEVGLSYAALAKRIERGWSVEEAATAPIGGPSQRRKENSARRKNAVKYTYNGMSLSLTDWAERLGISRHTLADRILTLKWGVEKALSTPPKKRKSKR